MRKPLMAVCMRGGSLASALLALLLVAGCAHHRPATPDLASAELAQRQNAFVAALAAADAGPVAALFAPDAVLHVAGMPPIEGADAIHRFYERLFGFLVSSEATPETLQVSAAGDMGYGTGRAFNVFRGPEGPVEHTGKYVLVWRKLGDEWRIVLYAVSSNQPDAPR